MAGRHVGEDDRFAAELQAHLLVKHPVRDGRRKLFPNDGLEGVLMRDDDGSRLLEHLRARHVIEMVVSQDDVFHRHVESSLDFVEERGRSAGHGGIDHQGAFARDQDESAVEAGAWTGRMPIEIALDLSEGARIIGAGGRSGIGQNLPRSVLCPIDGATIVLGPQVDRECQKRRRRPESNQSHVARVPPSWVGAVRHTNTGTLTLTTGTAACEGQDVSLITIFGCAVGNKAGDASRSEITLRAFTGLWAR